MPSESDDTLSFHTLFSSPLVSIVDYRCRAGCGHQTTEEHSDSNDIVLLRNGAFCRHFGANIVTADVNRVVFFSKESTYRVSHPSEHGDRGTVLRLSPNVLGEMVRELLHQPDAEIESFAFQSGVCTPEIFLKHRDLIIKLEDVADEQSLDRVWADVTALELAAEILESAFAQQQSLNIDRKRRHATAASHAEQVEGAQIYLSSHFTEHITLETVARAVHASPFHMSRIFQQHTGMPIHRYLTRLRLRTSLERLTEFEGELGTLALDIGFSSHSHFADAFQREFGQPPSRMTPNARKQLIQEVSKNLKA